MYLFQERERERRGRHCKSAKVSKKKEGRIGGKGHIEETFW
jgi:hypothetical protein